MGGMKARAIAALEAGRVDHTAIRARVADAVMSAGADLIRELRAENEALREHIAAVDRMKWPEEAHKQKQIKDEVRRRLDDVEQALADRDATIAAVRALADEWATGTSPYRGVAEHLRAALDGGGAK